MNGTFAMNVGQGTAAQLLSSNGASAPSWINSPASQTYAAMTGLESAGSSHTSTVTTALATSPSYFGSGTTCATSGTFCLHVNSLPAGTYSLSAISHLSNNIALAGAGSCEMDIYDGTTTISVVDTGNEVASLNAMLGMITYGSTQTNIEYNVRFYNTGAANTCSINQNNGGQGKLTMILKQY